MSAPPMSGPMTDQGLKTAPNAPKESWAVLETGNLGDDLYHGDDCLDPILLR